jgi:hypothetical protein
MFIPLKELSPNPRFGDIGDLGEMRDLSTTNYIII